MQPTQTSSTPAQTSPIGQTDWREVRNQQRVERHNQNQAAGVPVWGLLLIILGVVALLGNIGIGAGWIFGLALGAWLVYLGVRHVQEGQPVNWWLVGFGLLIGLGAVTSGFAFADNLIFPAVLVIVGLGILGEHYLSRERHAL